MREIAKITLHFMEMILKMFVLHVSHVLLRLLDPVKLSKEDEFVSCREPQFAKFVFNVSIVFSEMARLVRRVRLQGSTARQVSFNLPTVFLEPTSVLWKVRLLGNRKRKELPRRQ